MTDTASRLVQDARLSREARLMGLYLASLGDGEHEVATKQWQAILGRSHQGGMPKRDTIANYAAELEAYDYVERRPGGRGSPRYRFLRPSQRTVDGAVSAPPGGAESSAPLPADGRDPSFRPSQRGVEAPVGGDVGGGEVSYPQKEEEKEKTKNARGAQEVTHPISQKAAVVFEQENEKLNGCRGALRDYLEARVPTDRQLGFIRTVQSWLDGMDPSVFQRPDGSRAPPEQRTGILATALNELLASDETRMKGRPGDPRNLKTKLDIICRQGERRVHDASKKEGSGPTQPTADRIRGDRSRRRRPAG